VLRKILGSWNCRNRLAAPYWPLGATPEVRGVLIHENAIFRTFRVTVTAGRQSSDSGR